MSVKTTAVTVTNTAERTMQLNSNLPIRTEALTRAEMRSVTGERSAGGTKHSGYDTWGGKKTDKTKKK